VPARKLRRMWIKASGVELCSALTWEMRRPSAPKQGQLAPQPNDHDGCSENAVDLGLLPMWSAVSLGVLFSGYRRVRPAQLRPLGSKTPPSARCEIASQQGASANPRVLDSAASPSV